MGHARALVTVADPIMASELVRRAVRESWSVREIERRTSPDKIRRGTGNSRDAGGPAADPTQVALEEALGAHLATRVRVRGLSSPKGVIEVRFTGTDEFERLFELMIGREASDALS